MWFWLVLLVLIPVGLLVDLYRARHPTRGHWMLAAGFTGAYILFVALVGRWDFFSTYLPWLYLLTYLLVLYLPSKRASAPGSIRTARGESRLALAGRLLMGILLAALLVGSGMAYSGRAWADDIPSLVFPLQDGNYYVGGGGGSILTNRHQSDPAQAYALDVVKLNWWGGRAFGISPRNLERYEIFGERVFAPCSGTVKRAVDGQPDRAPVGSASFMAADMGKPPPVYTHADTAPSSARPPESEPAAMPASLSGGTDSSLPTRDIAPMAGNHIVLECEAGRILLAHLQHGSVRVAVGETVRVGDWLGRVGNSGPSTQPHLHVHVERGGSPGGILEGEGVAVQYEGRFLVRGQVFRARGPDR